MKNICLVVMLLSSFSTSFAQKTDSESDVEGDTNISSEQPTNKNENSSEQKNNNKTEQNKGNKQGDYQVFKPSEEISEDLSVPFPTDI